MVSISCLLLRHPNPILPSPSPQLSLSLGRRVAGGGDGGIHGFLRKISLVDPPPFPPCKRHNYLITYLGTILNFSSSRRRSGRGPGGPAGVPLSDTDVVRLARKRREDLNNPNFSDRGIWFFLFLGGGGGRRQEQQVRCLVPLVTLKIDRAGDIPCSKMLISAQNHT